MLVYVCAVIGRKAIFIVSLDVQLKQHCDSKNNDAIKAATSDIGHVKCTHLDSVG